MKNVWLGSWPDCMWDCEVDKEDDASIKGDSADGVEERRKKKEKKKKQSIDGIWNNILNRPCKECLTW